MPNKVDCWRFIEITFHLNKSYFGVITFFWCNDNIFHLCCILILCSISCFTNQMREILEKFASWLVEHSCKYGNYDVCIWLVNYKTCCSSSPILKEKYIDLYPSHLTRGDWPIFVIKLQTGIRCFDFPKLYSSKVFVFIV